MNAKIMRLFSVLVVVMLVIGLLPATSPASAQIEAVDPLQLLARFTGRDPGTIEVAESFTATLLNGQQVLRIKGVDIKTGESIGGDFIDNAPVDFEALKEEAGKQWRAKHGALTLDTVRQFEKLAPDDKVDIVMWLVADIQPVDRPDLEFEQDMTLIPDVDVNMDLTPKPLLSTGKMVDGKVIETPLKENNLPKEVRYPEVAMGESIEAPARSEEEIAVGEQALIDSIPSAAEDPSIEAFIQGNTLQIQDQVAAVQEAFQLRLSEFGLVASSTDTVTPTVVMEGVQRKVVEELAFWPEIDAIYIVPEKAGPALDTARPAQNGNLITDVGYRGTGVSIAVTEGERAYFANPYLVLRNCYNCGAGYASHPTAVAGFIKSSYSGYTGLANGADVDSANGSYSTWGTMSNAMNWATTNNDIVTNSWYWDNPNSSVFWAADRMLDYFVRYNYDTVTVAAGNFGNGCGGGFSNYVTSPAKGYNVISVGNHEEQDNITWWDDAMSTCSSFGDPANDVTGTTHEKPEVSAIGSTLDSTLPNASAPFVGAVGSGTSYAAPMVAALAADIIQARPSIKIYPEVVRAVIMASALQNVEGAVTISDKDGVGAVDFSAAAFIAERYQMASNYITNTTPFPINRSIYVFKGERFRFVATWLSNPNAAYTTDALPADLDLAVYKPDGTLQTGSYSSNNNFEIVDFTAPVSGWYQVRVNKWSYTGGNTWLGTAWWVGLARLYPNSGGTFYASRPLGDHIKTDPTAYSLSTNYWRAVGIRSNNSDHDIAMYTATFFDNPAGRSRWTRTYYSAPVEFIMVDGNHRSPTTLEYFAVTKWAGPGGWNLMWSHYPTALYSTGTYGPFSLTNTQMLKVVDAYGIAGGNMRITVIPITGNASDLGVKLFKSTDGTTSTYQLNSQTQYVASADASTSTTVSEQFTYATPVTDWYGLAVYSKTNAAAKFYIRLERP